ncbi:MAG: hypothetical protein F4Y28_02255 [Acidimicrobiia bacterium]|nr:hypothetical protein [Acidimicrobiia bacterium]MYJ31746.1 hypothetical protein [Acidimicrobiia bacterium]
MTLDDGGWVVYAGGDAEVVVCVRGAPSLDLDGSDGLLRRYLVLASYGGGVELSRVQWGSVSSFAVRISRFAECVAEAHRLGHGPGRSRKPWGIGFQHRACLIYAQTLRAEYLRGVADASTYCAGLMDGARPEDEVAADWGIVAEFLRSTSQALRELPEVAAVDSGAGAAEIGSAPPAVLRYELFAEMVSFQGVARLGAAAGAVVRCCGSHAQMVPTAQELEWLISVAAQEPIDELAERNKSSVRGMYRRIEKMWERLGVANQLQGIALAVQQGWIAPPPWGEAETRIRGSKN